MNLTELYQICKCHLAVHPKGHLIIGLKTHRQSEYRKFLNGPKGIIITRTKTEDLVSFETQKVLEQCKKIIKTAEACGLNPNGPSFETHIRVINSDLLKQSKAKKTTNMDNLDTPLVTPAELDSSLKIALQSGPFTALDLANLIWGTSYSTALELPLFTLGAWESLQTQLVARVRRRLLVLKGTHYYAPDRHEPPTYDPPYIRTRTP